ncbi:MAG: Ig-like domain-containing protein [Candidatus Neomarinimicrobiota bacterium]
MLRKATSFLLLLAFDLLAQAPTTVSTYPAQNALNVPLDTTVSVTFGVDMNPATINQNTFVAHGSYTGKLSGTYSYNPGMKTATFAPEQAFKVGELVSVTLTTGIQSAAGDTLVDPYIWSFTFAVLNDSATFAAADLDGDGDSDLAVANASSGYVTVLQIAATGPILPLGRTQVTMVFLQHKSMKNAR